MTNASKAPPALCQPILLSEYVAGAQATDKFAQTDIQPILLGLFGEIGSVMSAVKKNKREREAFVGYHRAVEEEFGDALWYLAALCHRLGVSLETILADATANAKYKISVAASGMTTAPLSQVSSVFEMPRLDEVLLALGRAVADLLSVSTVDPTAREKLRYFADCYLQSLQASEVSFAEVVRSNLKKVRGRFCHLILPVFRHLTWTLRRTSVFHWSSKSSSESERVAKAAFSGMGSL